MKIEQFPSRVRAHLIPEPNGDLVYRCLGCGLEQDAEALLYTCPACDEVLLISDRRSDRLKEIPGNRWREILDFRKALNLAPLKGIYRYHEFIGPTLPLDAVVYLGEGHTPVIEANGFMKKRAGCDFFLKNDGQNPSASFKDRGMASALSHLNFLVKTGAAADVLAVCASTGDTSAAAALYAAYLQPGVKSAVLLPRGKVTPQQLSQPLGSGARVFELPGVFDDCMKVVENLSRRYPVALLNSKNAWRILGQESYAYEIAQDFDYDMAEKVVVVPIGNAGNITAVLSGFLKFFDTRIIAALPKVLGVQSTHANPVFRYYRETDPGKRRFKPVVVRPSVAQAAMIGNPVSMPRVIRLVEQYNQAAGRERVFFTEVTEQQIMEWTILANRNGQIACTHGGECLAGLVRARKDGVVRKNEVAIVDATAHPLKFSGFQEQYFQDSFPDAYGIKPDPGLINAPALIQPEGVDRLPAAGRPLAGDDLDRFVQGASEAVARALNIK